MQVGDEYDNVKPFVCSNHQSNIEEYLNTLLTDSEKYDTVLQQYEKECKKIIKEYLLNNYDAITGWSDVRSPVNQESFPPSDDEKTLIIKFLCDNYWYSLGKNIIEVSYDNSLIKLYCDVKRLRKPYPVLPPYPSMPMPYYKRENFEIIDIKDLDE